MSKNITELGQNFTIVDGKIIVNGQALPPKEGIKPQPKHSIEDRVEASHKNKKKYSKRVPFIESS